MTTEFYFCEKCGNLIIKAIDSGVPVVCCGMPMVKLVPKKADTGVEKHLPVVTKVDNCTIRIDVSSIAHPMLPEHHIAFIYVETNDGGQLIKLDPTGTPQAFYCTCKNKPTAVYEYCNLHGLWKTEL